MKYTQLATATPIHNGPESLARESRTWKFFVRTPQALGRQGRCCIIRQAQKKTCGYPSECTVQIIPGVVRKPNALIHPNPNIHRTSPSKTCCDLQLYVHASCASDAGGLVHGLIRRVAVTQPLERTQIMRHECL